MEEEQQTPTRPPPKPPRPRTPDEEARVRAADRALWALLARLRYAAPAAAAEMAYSDVLSTQTALARLRRFADQRLIAMRRLAGRSQHVVWLTTTGQEADPATYGSARIRWNEASARRGWLRSMLWLEARRLGFVVAEDRGLPTDPETVRANDYPRIVLRRWLIDRRLEAAKATSDVVQRARIEQQVAAFRAHKKLARGAAASSCDIFFQPDRRKAPLVVLVEDPHRSIEKQLEELPIDIPEARLPFVFRPVDEMSLRAFMGSRWLHQSGRLTRMRELAKTTYATGIALDEEAFPHTYLRMGS